MGSGPSAAEVRLKEVFGILSAEASLRSRRLRHGQRPRLRRQRLRGARPLRGDDGVGGAQWQRSLAAGLAARAQVGAGQVFQDKRRN